MNKKHNKGRIYSAQRWAMPTKERLRQNGGVTFDVINSDPHNRTFIKRYRAVCECPLDAYMERKLISAAEHWAGLKFREAYFRGALCSKAAYQRKSQYTHDTGCLPGERVLKEAFRILSPQFRAAVIDVCGYDQPATDLAKLDRLQKGLGQLASLWNAAKMEMTGRY